ncbi:MAG: GAF domain-containing protein [Candidatus Eremiobacteraeota bacterium]|nr:GAF domain-containing protein [Candidatus Eremiobacteraeota bacterium]
MKRQFGTSQALIVLNEGGELVVRGALGDASVGPMTRALIGHVQREGKPHLVLDASQSFLPGCPASPLEFRSAACAPVQVEGSTRGYLVLRQPEAGAFSYANLQCINDWAQEMGPRLLHQPASVATQKSSPGLLLPALAMLALGLVWALVGILSPAPPTTPPSATPTPRLVDASARQVAGSFLGAIRQKQWVSGHQLLTPELQQRWPLEKFSATGQEYLADQEHRWDLTYRRPLEAEADGLLLVEAARGPGRAWRWRFTQTAEGWRIAGFESGPWS